MNNPSLMQKKTEALACLNQNRLQQARALYQEICQCDNQDADAWHMLSAVNGMMGFFAESEDCARRVIALVPDSVAAYGNLGSALLAQDKDADALSVFQAALALAPDFVDVLFGLGNLYAKQGKAKEAIQAYERILVLMPDHAQAFNNLGNVYLTSGRMKEALTAYIQALRINPSYIEAACNQGNVLREMNQYSDASNCYQRILRSYPDQADASIGLGSIYIKQRQFDEAITVFKDILKYHSENAEIHYHLGLALSKKGLTQKAVSSLQKALEINPRLGKAEHILATLGGTDIPERASDDYVVGLFDGYADKFEGHLTENLSYQIPELIGQIIHQRYKPGSDELDILDLGCGTGLCGGYLHDVSRTLTGVDLSPRMIEKTRQKNIYTTLLTGDVLLPLQQSGARYDLIVAADVFIYIGDLEKIFLSCQTVLRPEGLFVFSIEELEGDSDYVLRSSGRYAQSLTYIEKLSKAANLMVLEAQRVKIRVESAGPVFGYIVVTNPK